jgi:hypothetical protein
MAIETANSNNMFSHFYQNIRIVYEKANKTSQEDKQPKK